MRDSLYGKLKDKHYKAIWEWCSNADSFEIIADRIIKMEQQNKKTDKKFKVNEYKRALELACFDLRNLSRFLNLIPNTEKYFLQLAIREMHIDKYWQIITK